jgi:hypothetical protein
MGVTHADIVHVAGHDEVILLVLRVDATQRP